MSFHCKPYAGQCCHLSTCSAAMASKTELNRCTQDALDRERHRASTFRLLAQAGLAASLAEIATFYFTGQTSGVVREVVIGAIMAAYLTKE